jgi:GST-like protein
MGSPNVTKVLILLEELGVDYTLRRVDLMAGEQYEAWFRELNPNGKVPVLVDERGGGPVTIFESGAILLHLAEAGGDFLGETGKDRASVLQWLMFQMAGAGPIFGQAIHFHHVVSEPSYAQDRFGIEMRRLLAVIEQRLQASAFIAGSAYTIADMALWPWISTLGRFFPDDMKGSATQAWAAAIGERSGVISAMAKAKELAGQDKLAMRNATPDQTDRYFGRKG